MPTISDAFFSVRLSSGNRAVYQLTPEQAAGPAEKLAERCVMFGKQRAHEKGGRWYQPGGWVEITDPRTVALLERCSAA